MVNASPDQNHPATARRADRARTPPRHAAERLGHEPRRWRSRTRHRV